MRSRHGNRGRIGAALLAAIGALALLALPSAAAAKDRNHDRIPDRWEKRHHLSLKVKQTNRDQDRDGLGNRAEFLAGDNPRDRDSDDDGVIDGNENAGTIASFDQGTGRLVIDLFGGDSVSGLVTEGTRIECDQPDEMGPAGATASHDGEDNSGPGSGEDSPGPESTGDDDSGPESTGDDNSGPGNEADEPGDDNQGEDNDNDESGSCTTADLTQGTVVKEAELELENGSAAFDKVELVK